MATNVHRFKMTGEGRIKTYACSCGVWRKTGSKDRAEAIKAAWSQHASQAPRAGGDVPEAGAASSGSGSGTGE